MDVTEDIMAAVQQALGLIFAANGRSAGEYVIIAKMTVGVDGNAIYEWDRYYRLPVAIPGTGNESKD